MSMALPVGTRLGPYEISALLGVGGMGEVYRARDTRLGRTVALKVLPSEATADPDRRQSFEEEARTVAALNHPNICVLYDIGEGIPSTPASGGSSPESRVPNPDPVHFLVMEHLDGKSLAERLRAGPLPLEQALDVAIQMSDALDKAHGNGVVHRDVSPANVMLTKSGAKLLDFGLATLVAPEPGQDPGRIRTHLDPLRHRLIGTPYYMSPEQAKGQPADRRSDIFSMGVLLYEMVTGRRPFEGTNLVSVLASILRDTQVPVTRVESEPAAPARADHRQVPREGARAALADGGAAAAPPREPARRSPVGRAREPPVHRGAAVLRHERGARSGLPVRRHRRRDPLRAQPREGPARGVAGGRVPLPGRRTPTPPKSAPRCR